MFYVPATPGACDPLISAFGRDRSYSVATFDKAACWLMALEKIGEAPSPNRLHKKG